MQKSLNIFWDLASELESWFIVIFKGGTKTNIYNRFGLFNSFINESFSCCVSLQDQFHSIHQHTSHPGTEAEMYWCWRKRSVTIQVHRGLIFYPWAVFYFIMTRFKGLTADVLSTSWYKHTKSYVEHILKELILMIYTLKQFLRVWEKNVGLHPRFLLCV